MTFTSHRQRPEALAPFAALRDQIRAILYGLRLAYVATVRPYEVAW